MLYPHHMHVKNFTYHSRAGGLSGQTSHVGPPRARATSAPWVEWNSLVSSPAYSPPQHFIDTVDVER